MKAELKGEGVAFHGGCDGCSQQSRHGPVFCFDCCFFDAQWNKPNLNDKEPSLADLIREDIKAKRKAQ